MCTITDVLSLWSLFFTNFLMQSGMVIIHDAAFPQKRSEPLHKGSQTEDTKAMQSESGMVEQYPGR
jgi:hypothetical protein